MTGLPTPAEQAKLVAERAAQALTAAGGDRGRAYQALVKLARTDIDLFDALMTPHLTAACYDAIKAAARQDRPAAPSAPAPAHRRANDRALSWANDLLNYPILGGTRLRHATQALVRQAAEEKYAEAREAATTYNWLQAIADLMPADQPAMTVGQVLDEKRLTELRVAAAPAPSPAAIEHAHVA